MSLQSAHSVASYNPFGLLFRLGGAVTPWDWHGWPFPIEPPALRPNGGDGGSDSGGVSGLSAVKHELAHSACFTYTRLGVAISIETARLRAELSTKSAHDARLPVSEDCSKLLGLFVPILEGIAIYAEVDYDEKEGDEKILSHPVPHFAQGEAIRMQGEWQVHEIARNWSLFDHGDENPPGLLHLLFCDIDRPDLIHYTIGYLWVRAAAELIGRICPGLARPTVMLPLLTKLLCDHPVVSRLWRGEVTVVEAIEELRGSVLRTPEESWRRLDAALADREVRAAFDHWDLHGFLADSSAVRPALDQDLVTEFFRDSEVPDGLEETRLAAHVWLWSEKRGKLIDIFGGAPEAGEPASISEAILKLWDEATGSETEVQILSPMLFWELFEHSTPASIPAEQYDEAKRVWEMCLGALAGLRGRRVRICPVIGFFEPPLIGTIMWPEDAPKGLYVAVVLTPEIYAKRDGGNIYAKILHSTGRFSPWERDELVAAVSGWDRATEQSDECMQALLADLCSEPADRAMLLDRRLEGMIPTKEGRRQLRAWMSFSEDSLFRTSTKPGPDALIAVDGAIDLPAFRSVPGAQSMRARNLLLGAYP